MEIRLDLGVKVIKDESNTQDAFECVLPLVRLIPDTHEFLIRFLDADIQAVINLIEKAVTEKDRSFVFKALSVLQKIHPYLEDNNTASSYINHEIACQIIKQTGVFVDSNDELISKCNNLFSELALLDDHLSAGESIWYWGTLIHDSGYGSVSSIKSFQEDLNKLVSLFFMDTNSALSRVPLSVRAGLYGLVSTMQSGLNLQSEPGMVLPAAKYVLSYPTDIHHIEAKMDFDEEFSAKVRKAIEDIDQDSDTIPEFLNVLIQSVRSTSNDGDFIEYKINFLEELLSLEVYLMSSENVRIRKCANCGRRYAVSMNGAFSPYCDYTDDKGRSCRKQFKRKELISNISRNYVRAYKRHYSRVTKGIETQEDLSAWMDKMRIMKSKVLSNEITMDEYLSNL